jgi:membrane dipeptidase
MRKSGTVMTRIGTDMRRMLIAALLLGALPASGPAQDSLLQRARQLARKFILVDTHIDAPYRLAEGMEDLTQRTAHGEFDYVRAREGGLDVPFMSIYTSSSLEGTGKAKPKADTLIDRVLGLARSAPDAFAVVTSVGEIRKQVGQGKILLAMGMENGSPLEERLENVRYFYGRGIRYLGLAHAKSNHLADASYDTVRRWHGLSPFGRKVIQEMNRLGMMVDLSHLTDSAAAQAIRLSRAPVIASHSSCRAFTPGFERNLSDELIRAVARRGGVVQVNFGASFIDDDFRLHEEREQNAVNEHFAQASPRPDEQTVREYREAYRADHPYLFPDVRRVADHIDHIVSVAGVDHAGFGSDFDGVGDTLPLRLKSVAEYPNLIAELLRRGYAEDAIRKICGENLLRVWSAVERTARESGGTK